MARKHRFNYDHGFGSKLYLSSCSDGRNDNGVRQETKLSVDLFFIEFVFLQGSFTLFLNMHNAIGWLVATRPILKEPVSHVMISSFP